MKKGFTLLELLIVIGILAILATVAVLVLNPAELLKQARDGQRLSDLRAINSALELFIVASSTPLSGASFCTASTTFYGGGVCTQKSITTVDGLGWVNVNFSSMQGGSPLSRIPLDPVNNSSYNYNYKTNATDGSKFELDADMESAKYSASGGSDVESNTKDGGNNANVYEIGTSLTEI